MNTEFEDMREQMNILKMKLQEQAIVNERVLRHSMKRSMTGINRRYTFVSILCLLMIPYSYWAFVELSGMSFYFWIATCVLMLICFGYTLYNGRHLSSRLFEKDLVEARTKVAEAKKLDHDWLKIGIPLAVLWLAFFAYEQYRLYNGGDWKILVASCIIGAVVGAAIGLKMHFRIQDDYEQIIGDLEDLAAGK